MPTTKVNPSEYFAVHYVSKSDGTIKKYCSLVNEYCICGAALDKPHAEGCTQKEHIWFGRSSWMDCGEIVVADSPEAAWKNHLTRCTNGS